VKLRQKIFYIIIKRVEIVLKYLKFKKNKIYLRFIIKNVNS